jgi:hypothetical protein
VDGQAVLTDELRARRCSWSPLPLARVCREHESVCVACSATLPLASLKGGVVRGLGLDVHRDFCEVAIAENNTIGSAGGFRRGARRWNCLRRAWRRVMSRRLRRRLGPIRSCRHRRLRGRARGRCEHAEAPVDRPGEGQDRLAGRQDAGATAGLGGCSMRPFAWVRARSLHGGRAPGTLHRNTPQGRAPARLRATCGYARSPSSRCDESLDASTVGACGTVTNVGDRSRENLMQDSMWGGRELARRGRGRLSPTRPRRTRWQAGRSLRGCLSSCRPRWHLDNG